MDLITLWPDVLLLPSFAPVEPVNGLRSVRVRLGRWWSPMGFPWDVSVALLRWRAGAAYAPEPPAAGPLGDALAVPTLILTPLPWLQPSTKAEADVDVWLASRRGDPPGGGEDHGATWGAFATPLKRPADLRQQTLAAMEHVDKYVSCETAAGAEWVERLQTVAGRAPWHLLLSVQLRAQLATALALTGPVLQGELLVAAHQWLHATVRGRGRDDHTASADSTPLPPPPTKEDLECGMFELLDRRRGSKRVTRQKISNYIAGVSRDGKNEAIRRECTNLHKSWRRKLAELPLNAVLVPLPRVPHELGLAEVAPAPGAWALEWLAAGRASHLLRLVFGRHVDRLTWCTGPDLLAAGLGPFVELGWTRSTVVEPAGSSDCARIEWTRNQEPGAHSDESSALPKDIGEYFRLVVAPAEHDGHAAERYLAEFTAGVAMDSDVHSILNRLAGAGATAVEGKRAPVWASVLDACAAIATARIRDLESRGTAPGEPSAPVTRRVIGSQAAAEDTTRSPSVRRQTGKDLLVYRRIAKLEPHGAAGALRVTKEEILRAEGALWDPLPEPMHLALLDAKKYEEQLFEKLSLPPPNWEAPLRSAGPAAPLPDALTGATLKQWRAGQTQAEVARRWKVGQSEISKAESKPKKALPPALQQALAAELANEPAGR